MDAGSSVLSAGPISSRTDNLAHLTSRISPSSHQTLKLHSASDQSDLHWVVTALSRCPLIGHRLQRQLLIGLRTMGGSNLVWSLLAVMGVYIILFRMNPLSFSDDGMAFRLCRDHKYFSPQLWTFLLHKGSLSLSGAAWKFSRGHFYNFISLPLNIKMIYIQ